MEQNYRTRVEDFLNFLARDNRRLTPHRVPIVASRVRQAASFALVN
jgi:hypothetical protein